MQNKTRSLTSSLATLAGTFAALMLAGCSSDKSNCPPSARDSASAPVAEVASAPAPVPVVASVAPLKTAVRIRAGSSEKLTDSAGNVWLPEQGFDAGDIAERPDLAIANTKDPALYRSEHYSMNSFSWPLPNGKYVVKLHFCETFEGIEGPGQRVFSFNVEGHEFKDFDVWVKAGGPLRAYVETVNVEVNDGKLDIAFTPNIENPQINGLEIIPAN